MANALTMKLEQFCAFSPENRQKLDQLASGKLKKWAAKKDIVAQGDHVDHIHLVVSGIAMRNKVLPNGKRQVLAFLIPGDLCDLEVFVLAKMDHAITAVAETTCALIPADTIKGLLTDMQGITQALWWSTMTDSAVLRERIIDHGQRGARERLAHLFYEMLVRYRMVGLAAGNNYPFPVTQEQLADATGLTPVHVNRTLQTLRVDGLIEFSRGRVNVLNAAGLKKVAQFSADYLHLQQSELGVSGVAERVRDLL